MKIHGNELDLHDNKPVEQTQFHMNDLARRLRFDTEEKRQLETYPLKNQSRLQTVDARLMVHQ